MTRKLSDADDAAIAKDLEARRNLRLKELCKRWGVNKASLYEAAKRAKRRQTQALCMG